jgi:hypothetical protein
LTTVRLGEKHKKPCAVRLLEYRDQKMKRLWRRIIYRQKSLIISVVPER